MVQRAAIGVPMRVKLWIILCFCCQVMGASPLVSLDLDGLLFYSLSNGEHSEQPLSEILSFTNTEGTRYYRKSRWADHFLLALLEEGFEIGILSAEQSERNLALLEQMALPVGTLRKIVGTRVFNQDALRDTKEFRLNYAGVPGEMRGRFKKPLSLYRREVTDIIHLDDKLRFAEPAEAKQWLWVTGEDCWSLCVIPPYGGWLGKQRERWKLARAMGILLEARDEAQRTSRAIGEILYSWQWEGNQFRQDFSHQKRFYERGMRTFEAVAAKYPTLPQFEGLSCREMAADFALEN